VNKKTKKLKLTTETLRLLGEDELTEAAGGTATTSNQTNCTSACTACTSVCTGCTGQCTACTRACTACPPC
jgi:hypothetical protein